jgi:hypothetical protein
MDARLSLSTVIDNASNAANCSAECGTRRDRRSLRRANSPRRRVPFAAILEQLEARSMMAANPLGSPPALPVQSFDGTGNNVAHAEWGSTDEQLLRRSAAAYGDGISTPSGADRPSARLVSNLLAESPEGGITNDRDYTAMAYAWGQFLDHDIGLTDGATPRERFSIAVPTGDPWFDPNGTGAMTISMSRSAWDSTPGSSLTGSRPSSTVPRSTAPTPPGPRPCGSSSGAG